MPSQEMQDLIDGFREQQKASDGQSPPRLAERRATFAPGGRPHPVPGDVRVTDVTADGVPAHWLAGPGADTGRVLLFLHGLARHVGTPLAWAACLMRRGWRFEARVTGGR